MKKKNPDKKSDILTDFDRGEPIGWMEPMLIREGSRHRSILLDLAVELASKTAGFRRSLPVGVAAALADLVRSMNCYYSNLIEGHNTHPIDIERALKNDYSQDIHKRDLQLEAKAHIAVQKWIDEGGLAESPVTKNNICEIHRRFSALLPEDLLWVEDVASKKRAKVVSGEFRKKDVRVGKHIAISPGAIERFLHRFEEVFVHLGKTDSILALAAAHHRLLWIHPFLDGNGRVARLMSHAMLLKTLDTGALWSISRGLARRVVEYKSHLANCDLPRRNDLDGRGHLSEEALFEFTQFFLETCLDQVVFMEKLVEPERLRARILLWAEEEIRIGAIPNKSSTVLETVLYRGELPKNQVASILGTSDRHARRLIAALCDRGVLTSAGSRAPLRLTFPATLASRFTPGLFPER